MKISGNNLFTKFEAESLDDIATLLGFRGKFGHYASFTNSDRSVQGVEIFTAQLLDLLARPNHHEWQYEPGKWTRATLKEPFITCARNDGTYVQVALLNGETPDEAYERFHAADTTE